MFRSEDIAFVGISTLFPGSEEKHGFWHNILQGKDLMTDIPPTHWPSIRCSVSSARQVTSQAGDRTHAKCDTRAKLGY